MMVRWVLLGLLLLVLACEQPAPLAAEPTPPAPLDWEATSLTDPVTHLTIGGAVPAANGPGTILYALTRPQGTSDVVLWRSDDAATTWQRLELPARRIGDLAVNEKDGRFVYVAGEGGIYRSADGGTSWSRTLSDMPGLRVAVSPADPALLYAATGASSSAATWRSGDGGTTWEQLRRLQGYLCIWTFPVIAPDPVVPDRVYSSTYCAAGRTQAASLSVSEDRWSTSKAILSPSFQSDDRLASLFPEAVSLRGDRDSGVVAARRGFSTAGVLLRTDDGGRSWQILLEYPRAGGYIPGVRIGNFFVEPPGADRLFLGLGGDGRGVMGSEDGGRSFGPVGTRTIGAVSTLAMDSVTGRLYAGTDRGIWRLEGPTPQIIAPVEPGFGPWHARVVTILGGDPAAPGVAPLTPRFWTLAPYSLAVEADGSLLVAHAGEVLRLRADGTLGKVDTQGPVSVGLMGLTADRWLVYSVGRSSYSPSKSVEAISPEGERVWVAGWRPPVLQRGYAVKPPEVPLADPAGVAVDAAGAVYVADGRGHRVYRIQRDGSAQVVAGSGRPGWSGDGLPATDADLEEPWALAMDGEERLLIVDRAGQRVVRVENDGRLVTIAGSGLMGYAGDGGPATEARLAFPSAVTVDADGRVYIADALNHAVRVVDRDGTIWTLAGIGAPGAGEDGPAAGSALNLPLSLAWDGGSGIYVADYGNNRVRWIGPVR